MRAVVRCTLRDQRNARGLSLKTLAGMLDIHHSTLSNYEREVSELSIERAALVALVLGCTLDDLFEYKLVEDESD